MQIAEPQGAVSGPVTAELAPSRRRQGTQIVVSHAADVAAVSLLLALVAVVSWDRLWRTTTFADADVTTFFVPWYSFLGEHIRRLDVPGWIPNTLSGTPFAADPESGWGYLPAMISFAMFPPILAYKAMVIFQLTLAGTSTYLFARLIGFGALGSFAAAATWTFGPSIGVGGCCTVLSELSAWIAPAFVGVELVYRARRWPARMVAIVFTGLAISQILAGWLGQGTYYGLLVIGSYFAFRMLVPPSDESRALLQRFVDVGASGLLSLAFGFGFGAAAFLPRLENVSQTFLGSSEYRDTSWCQPNCGRPWYVLLKMLVSRPEYWYPYYIGGAALACATMGLFGITRRRELFYFAGLALVIFMLAMRNASIQSLFYLLPQFEGLHVHASLRIFILLPLPIALFVGAAVDGFDRIVRHTWALGFPILARFVWWVAVFAVPVASLEIAPYTRRAYLIVWMVIFVGVLLALSWTRQRLPHLASAERVLPVILIVLVLWDLTGRSVFEAVTNPASGSQTRQTLETTALSTAPGGAVAFLQAKQASGERFRYFGYVAPPNGNWQPHEHFQEAKVLQLLLNNRAIRLGLEDFQGYNPGQLERYRLVFQALNGERLNYHEDSVLFSGLFSPFIDLLNVRYIVVPNNAVSDHARYDLFLLSTRYDQVFMNDEVRVLENPNALPRAWMVHDVMRTTPSGARDRLAQGKVDPRERALVEVAPPPVSALPEGAEDAVTITGYDDDSITLTADAKADGFLVLSEVYNPGWRVKVDGKLAQLFETDYILRGVAVPRGTHEIVFTYQPNSLKYGLFITFATSVLAGLISIWAGVWWWRRRVPNA